MNIFISIVSHGHGRLLNEIGIIDLFRDMDGFYLVIKNNKADDDVSRLPSSNNISIIDEHYGCGFGENNNIVYQYCIKNLGMLSNDYFIVLNPDVDVKPSSILTLCQQMHLNNERFATINLYRDFECRLYDYSIRHYPTLLNFIESYLGFKNRSVIDKGNIEEKQVVDWAAGSFLAFQSQHYQNLKGFDESYFMYCEDIDICFRSKQMNVNLVYYPKVSAIHKAQHANRKIISKHFFWHIKSVIRYILSRYGLIRNKSRL